MQVTTLSFFRFDAFWHRFWAFFHMGLAPAKLRHVPKIDFFKVMGTGRGGGFNPAPNFNVYCILATWPSSEAAHAGFEDPAYRTYSDKATETWHLFLSAIQGHGTWDARQPFVGQKGAEPPRPIGILTRASIRWTQLVPFWRSVPAVSATTEAADNLRFRIGMGERPVMQLMTFSLWDDVASVKAFAYAKGHHRCTMQKARDDGWFNEELFARFRVLESRGTWEGRDPLADCPAPRLPGALAQAAE